jgi:hypothetical protein
MVNVGGCAAGNIQFLGPDVDRQFQHLRRLVDEQRTMLARVGIPGSGPIAELMHRQTRRPSAGALP